MADIFPAPPIVRVPIRSGGFFPVHRVYCVGRNFADHAREMGMQIPDRQQRGTPIFFLKPADAITTAHDIIYPSETANLHHEVELVVAIGQPAPVGSVSAVTAKQLILGYGVGLDLTRRDLQMSAKTEGWPWDTAKSFDQSAPISELVLATDIDHLENKILSLYVNGQLRQQDSLNRMIWNVADILQALSRFYTLHPGDLVFMGTPAGVAALQPGDEFTACLESVVERHGRIISA